MPSLLSAAVSCHQTGLLVEAVFLYNCMLLLKPGAAEIHSSLGVALADLGRRDEAEAAYRRAIALKPDFGEAYNNLGNLLCELGRLDDGTTALRQALVLMPSCAQVHSNLGLALRDQGRLEEAEAAYHCAIALDPDHAEAYNNLGDLLIEQGNLDRAEAALRQAMALDPSLAEAKKNLGIALMQLGRMTEAQQSVEQAICLSPRKAEFFRTLGYVRRFCANDPYVAMMEELAEDRGALSVKDQISLHFASAKAYEDLGHYEASFRQLLAGNQLKRRQIAYDEAAALGMFERTQAVFDSGLVQAPRKFAAPSSKPVFIIGMPRSGTTLLEQILASHPQVFGAGELTAFADAMVRVSAVNDDSWIFPEAAAKLSSTQFMQLGGHYAAELTRLAPVATHITDKMSANCLHVGLIHLSLPNAIIIHVVRNPIDTCFSCFSNLFTAGQDYSYDLAELGRYYRRYEALMAHWHRVLPPGRILDVCYEDMVADLEAQARRVIAHCGLEWDPRCVAFHRTERPIRTASAVQVRQPIYANAIGRWRNYESFLDPLLAELPPGLPAHPVPATSLVAAIAPRIHAEGYPPWSMRPTTVDGTNSHGTLGSR